MSARVYTDDDGFMDVRESLEEVVAVLELDGGYARLIELGTGRRCAVNKDRVVGVVDLSEEGEA